MPANEKTETVEGSPASAEVRELRLLMVEDNEDDALLLFAELEAKGHCLVHRRVDTAEALKAALREGGWDVVISDHDIPGFSSMEALTIVKQLGDELPFIIYSGHISETLATSAMKDGAGDYIRKGHYDRLIPVIEREIRGAAARRAVRQADHRIQQLAFYDDLTGLPNQNRFCLAVSERMQAKPGPSMILVMDLVRFMRINNSFGFEAGNTVLEEVASRLAQRLPEGGELARVGGDRFAVMIPGIAGGEDATESAHDLLQVFDKPFLREGLELFVTANAGMVLIGGGEFDVRQAIVDAETAMAQQKKKAPAIKVCLFDSTMNRVSVAGLELENDLRHAGPKGEFLLEFQPTLDLATGRVRSAEALIRWQHPQRGLVSPVEFVPVADESGLIIHIGEWVLREACHSAQGWPDARVSVAVNVSAVQFGQPKLVETVESVLKETRLAPHRLGLEITESALMEDVESALATLAALKKLGVTLLVDDFGTGYSSLSYLKRFPIDVLKVDQSFIRDLPHDDEDAAIVGAIIALARSLRLTTVAEGVETAEQLDFLRAAGCDVVQGYHIAYPMGAATFSAWLSAQGRVGGNV